MTVIASKAIEQRFRTWPVKATAMGFSVAVLPNSF